MQSGAQDDGWEISAPAWIADMAETGDEARRYVLDGPMLARLRTSGARDMVDIGCGEGRFCRMAQAEGLMTIGIDPTEALLTQARTADVQGDYRLARAEALPLPDASTDLAVFYLTFIDIPDIPAAIAEATRILRPGGRLLVANLAGLITAARHDGWQRRDDNSAMLNLKGYLEEDSYWTHWRGIRIRNWHRPPSFYFQALLGAGLRLTHYDEPRSSHPDPARAAHYDEVAYLTLMEWQKPG